MTGQPPRNRATWHYAVAGLFIAAIAAVISYNDGLFVARLAGNHDRQAFLYPFLPDGLIVVGLIALLEAARRNIPRSRWATGAVLLGVAMTLAMNAGAGVAHSALDAVMDGLVPVAFFVAAEVVLWHVRRGRAGPGTEPRSVASGAVPSDVLSAARMRLKFATEHGFKVTPNDTQQRFGLTRAAARELHAEFAPKDVPAGAGSPPQSIAPAGALDVPPAAIPGAAGGAGRAALNGNGGPR